MFVDESGALCWNFGWRNLSYPTLLQFLGKCLSSFPTLTEFPLFFLSQDFLNKFQRAKDAMEYARKSAAESATATVSEQ